MKVIVDHVFLIGLLIRFFGSSRQSTFMGFARAGLSIWLSMSLAHMQTKGQLRSRPQEPITMQTGLRLFWLQYVNVRLVFCVGVQVRTHSAKRLITIQAAKVQKKSHICKYIWEKVAFFLICAIFGRILQPETRIIPCTGG